VRNGVPEKGRLQRIDRDNEERDQEELSNLRAEAAMCYLRGICYAKQNAFERAKECYKDAVRIDVLNFEAFDALMSNSLMSPTEEWEFLSSLNFDAIVVGDGSNASTSQEAAEFTKLLYTTRLSKYGHSADFAAATETLSTHYKLASNPDIQLSKASLLYTQCRFREALELTSNILTFDPYNVSTLPQHLACLHELQEKNALYLLSHSLADTHPNSPLTYLAIGTYYLTISSIASARRYFSQASMLDPTLAAAWLGFAHTFSIEGEHEQAISAYSTAARLFPGTHLPNLFLGMQNLALGNLKLSKEYFKLSWDTCCLQTESSGSTQSTSNGGKEPPICGDPLLLNELAVVFYHEQDYHRAINTFSQALALATDLDSPPRAWVSTRSNLAHALRRIGDFPSALEQFNIVLRIGGKDAAAFAAKGLTLMEMGEMREAAVALHEALAVSPQDPMATELLNRCMSDFEVETVQGVDVEEDDEFERKIGELAAQFPRRGRRGRRKGKLAVEESSELMMEDESMMVDDDD
jgi:anaphase-promoting complex subunit 6